MKPLIWIWIDSLIRLRVRSDNRLGFILFFFVMVNYFAVGVCAIVSMIVGGIWYGPLFGKMWLKVIGATELDLEARKRMQARAMPLYGVQFLLSLFQVWVLAGIFEIHTMKQPVLVGLLVWAGFIMPMIAANSMWNNDSAKIAWTRFLIQSSYQLVMFVIYTLILSAWV